MVDKPENILVEFDYNNIAVIDPNKVIDEFGRAKERLVKHEELVMYANLECKVLPRSKLLLGSSNSDNLQTISVASMNFLNPGNKTFIDNAYTDEITGKDTLRGQGVNQPNIEAVRVPSRTNQFYLNQSIKSNGGLKATDNGLLGIKQINFKIGTEFEPVVTIKLEDVRGRALFEAGNNSPYSAFFNLPYPLFNLTLKGYYGKATRIPLQLQDFVADYNSVTGNFDITLTMYGYRFTILSEITLGALVATPHMYKSTIQTQPKTPTSTNTGINSKVESRTQTLEYGYQKIQEVYSEYKSKGLIPNDFPEITVIQMQKRLDQFIQTVLDSYSKQDLDPLTNISDYESIVAKYKADVFLAQELSWFNKYMDKKKYYVLKKDKVKIYTFAAEFLSQKISKINELKAIIEDYNSRLSQNDTLGVGGKYKVGKNDYSSEITNKIEYKLFEITDEISATDIDFEETFRAQTGSNRQPTEADISGLTQDFLATNAVNARDFVNLNGTLEQTFSYFKFEGKNSFMDNIDKMLKEVQTKKNEVETRLTEDLTNYIKSKNNVLGFVPTIRNVLAVLFATSEAYLRLLDEVHTKAMNQAENKDRKNAIFKKSTAGANPDAVAQGESSKVIVYPWPEYLVETTGEKGEEKFVYKYPGDTEVLEETRGSDFVAWPECEFVEEFIRGITIKQEGGPDEPSNNEVTESTRVSLNAIEYPTNNDVYSNKEETKFFFEILERLILTSFYSKFLKSTYNPQELSTFNNVLSDIEKNNIIQSVGVSSPYLREKLANYALNGTNYLPTLRQFSNQGVGESWQNYIRGIFNTSYIKNLVDNKQFKISNIEGEKVEVLGQTVNAEDVTATVSFEGEDDVIEYLTGSTTSSKIGFTETYPFVSRSWSNSNLAGNNPTSPAIVQGLTAIQGFNPFSTVSTPVEEYFDTRKNLTYNKTFKSVANFSDDTLFNGVNEGKPRPFSSYNFLRLNMASSSSQTTVQPELNLNNLNAFYENRVSYYNMQLPTEGELNYANQSGLLTQSQTVSILNTPFFVNSIQEGVQKFRNYDPYPYKVPAYLFLNSLSLSTLREKYTKLDTSITETSSIKDNTEYLNYIFATLKKFGAIHRVPLAWVLKIGSVWHRYKVWVETGQDILDGSWKDFDYLGNFDPISSAITKTYSLTLANNQNVDITIEDNTTIGTQDFTQLNTGFYPQTINDFNVFYQGFRLFTGYTSSDIQDGITQGLSILNSPDANITVNFGEDPFNADRFIQSNAWSSYVLSKDNLGCFILPSHGSNINQAQSECFSEDNNLLYFELSGNKSVYNGSVRTFWNAPNYGYFDVSQIVKPRPDEYMKKVFGGYKYQQNFSINGSSNDYTSISEIFSVFEKEILDQFEEKFLNFSRPKYNYTDVQLNISESQQTYGNFQLFFTDLMKVPTPATEDTTENIINALQTSQIQNFSNKIRGFMNFDVLLNYGNPSNFDRKLFYTFSNKEIVDPYEFESYNVKTPGALPTSANTVTVIASKLAYPNEWNTLLTYVGFTGVDGIDYKDSGSTIFDFFVDFDIAFTTDNIKICSPIIKIYATQKYLNSNLNFFTFKIEMDKYIDKGFSFINDTLNLLFPKVSKDIGEVKITTQSEIQKQLQGGQSKLELYKTFKATNDKWIAGNDYKSKTLFEDVLLLDRASRDIGDKVVVDIFDLRGLFTDRLSQSTNMTDILKRLLVANKFQSFNIPGYVNFYGIQEVSKNATPKPEGSLELANSLFGTFLDVDYRESSTKYVCFYGGAPSVQLDTQAIIEGYKNDAFDLRRASDCPLVEDQTNKTDYAQSNKVVGFSVDIGPQNQGIFKTFSVSQKNSTPTAEALQILSDMAAQAGGRGVATQNLSLYNLYKVRSYDCSITMMGNALIQPLMYFNLRYVPMFSGPYMITGVQHEVSPGTFNTTVTGVRQAIANYQTGVDFIQSLRTNLVQKIIQKKQEDIKRQKAEESKNIINNKDQLVSESLSEANPATSSSCSAITKYDTYSNLEGDPTSDTITPQQLKDKIISIGNEIGIPTITLNKLKYALFSLIYLNGNAGVTFKGYNNNFTGVNLTGNWGGSETYFSSQKKFFCMSKGDKIIPYVVFDSIDNNIKLFLERWRQRSGLINQVNSDEISKFVTTNSSPNDVSVNTWFAVGDTDKEKIKSKVQEAINLFDSLV